jgi:tetratricopeptide (TPR) repeat protein
MSSKKTKQPKQQAGPQALEPSPRNAFVLAGLITYAALLLFASMIGSQSLWGMNFSAYLSGYEIYLFSTAFLIAIVLGGKGTLSLRNIAKVSATSYWIIALTFVAGSVLITANMHVAFAFLGDGAIYLGEVYRVATVPGYESNLTKFTTYLAGHAIIFITQALKVENSVTPFIVIGPVSIAVLWSLVFYLLRKEKFPATLFIATLILGSGGMLLYFGYVELYTLGYTFTVAYFLAGWSVYRSKLSMWVPGVFLILAVASAISSAVFIPSYLLLLHWKLRGTGGRPNLKQSAIILSVLPFAAVVAAYLWLGIASGNAYLISLVPYDFVEAGINYGTQNYTLLSATHLLDLANTFILDAGIAFILLLLSVVWRKDIKWNDAHVLFSLTALSGALSVIIFGNATFGLARDWDIMTIPSLAIVFAAAVLTVHISESRKLSLAALLPALLIISLGNSYFWVRINVEDEASAQRFTDIVNTYEPQLAASYTFNGLENLRKYHHGHGNMEKHLDVVLTMAELRYNKLSSHRELIGFLKTPAGAVHTREGFKRLYDIMLSSIDENIEAASFQHIPEADWEEFAVQALISGREANLPELADIYFSKFNEAFEIWETSVFYEASRIASENPALQYEIVKNVDFEDLKDIALIIRAAGICKRNNQFGRAAELYEKALAINPHEYQKVYILLAQVYYRGLQDRERTIETLLRCQQNCLGTEQAEQATEILAKLQQQ